MDESVNLDLTRNIIEIASDETFAHWDEYRDRLIRDANKMLEEVEVSRKFFNKLRVVLTKSVENDEMVDPAFILRNMPKGL